MTFIVFLVSSAGKTPYNYFTRLADSFLHGRYYITENPPWLSELIPAGGSKFFVVYPPAPALLLMPFVALFSADFPQQIFAHILGAGIVTISALVCYELTKSKTKTLWIALLVGFGNIMWFMSSVGSVWYLGQITSAFFLTLAIYEALTRKRLFLIGLCIGLIYLSRPHVILATPLLLYLLKDKLKSLKNIFQLCLSALPFFLFGFGYNFIRFGSIFDKAYFILPEILHETNAPWFIHGVENPLYIPNNLRTIFLALPKSINVFPYLVPSWNGLAIWITTPAFIYALLAPLKERLVQISWFCILLISLVVFSHGGNGFAQFGYRFAVDFYPILILLLIKGISRKKLTWHHWLLLILSILVNVWGVLLINKLNMVSP